MKLKACATALLLSVSSLFAGNMNTIAIATPEFRPHDPGAQGQWTNDAGRAVYIKKIVLIWGVHPTEVVSAPKPEPPRDNRFNRSNYGALYVTVMSDGALLDYAPFDALTASNALTLEPDSFQLNPGDTLLLWAYTNPPPYDFDASMVQGTAIVYFTYQP